MALSLSTFSNSMIIPALADAMNKRLGYMKYVAAYKSANNLRVEDLSREEEVLLQAKKTAQISGLLPCSVNDFIQTQMDVCKSIQYRYCAEYILMKRAKLPSSIEYVREKLIEIDISILDLVGLKLHAGSGFNHLEKNELMKFLYERHIKSLEKEYLVSSLFKIERNL